MFDLTHGETVNGTIHLKVLDMGEVHCVSGKVSMVDGEGDGVRFLRVEQDDGGTSFIREEMIGAFFIYPERKSDDRA